jgi:hypothetical protein
MPRKPMSSYRDIYFEKAYALLNQFIDETGREDEQLTNCLEDRDVDGLLAWADENKDDVLAAPIRLFASGIMLDRTLEELADSAEELSAMSEKSIQRLEATERALLAFANMPSPRWIH